MPADSDRTSGEVRPPRDDFEAFYRAHVDGVYRALAVTLRPPPARNAN